MVSISDLALKGFFHTLKDEMNWRSGTKDAPRLINLLAKAVGVIEEVYEKDFNLLHPDNALDYREMVQALNDYGLSYKGNNDILNLATRIEPATATPGPIPEKMPMKKAKGAKRTHAKSEIKRKSG